MDTLYSLWRDTGHDPRVVVRGDLKPISSGSNWSGPGELEQWPGVQELIFSQSGAAISERAAMNYASVYASVRILSLIDGALSVHLYRHRGDGGRDPIFNDYRARLLHTRPNPEMSAALFRVFMKQNRCLWGNAYAWIEWKGTSNRAEAIWPMRPDWMTVFRRKSGRKVYHYEPQDEHGLRAGYYDPDEMLHFRGMGDDLVGWSPIRCARQGIELGMAAQTFGTQFFRNGARPSGVLQVDSPIKKELREQVQKDFQEKYASASNAGKVLMIDGSSKFTATTIPPDDAQYLETRQFQGGEISAKIYGVPPHLTGDTEKQTSWGTGVEQMAIGFVTFTIMPECVIQEGEINMRLLDDDNNFYCKYNLAVMLRADFKSQQEALAIMRQNGVLNGDEWREKLDMNPIEDGSGKTYIVPANMTTIDELKKRLAQVEASVQQEQEELAA